MERLPPAWWAARCRSRSCSPPRHQARGDADAPLRRANIQFGAAKFLHLERREPRWRAAFLILATAAIVYTFYKQVHPTPPHPYDLFPFIIGGWAVLGIGVTLVFPALARRIGQGLAEAEGLAAVPVQTDETGGELSATA